MCPETQGFLAGLNSARLHRQLERSKLRRVRGFVQCINVNSITYLFQQKTDPVIEVKKMTRIILFSLVVTAVFLGATTTGYAQGMGANPSQGRSQSVGAQRQRASEGLARRDTDRLRSQRDSHAVSPDEQGSETAMEMRERRDERTQIMEEYRETREPGQEGRSELEDREEQPAKKRWWKFWDN